MRSFTKSEAKTQEVRELCRLARENDIDGFRHAYFIMFEEYLSVDDALDLMCNMS